MPRDPLSRTLDGFLNLFRRKPPVLPAPVQPPAPPPEPEKPPLRVTSHVSRDLLQNAAYFSALPRAVAEYVTNAIDSGEPGKAVHCEVTVSPAEVSIADDGSGMTYTELSNFFQMHGENLQRKRGRSVRGRFGTGKSAAFGIASSLQIETVRAGLRSLVELQRADVESARDGQPIPVRTLAADQPAPGAPSGTVIRIRDLLIASPDPHEVQDYIEKLLSQHLRTHRVRVNGQRCRYRMPPAELTFDFQPPQDVGALLGRAKCRLRVSPDELGREDNVIAVFCHGYLHATTLAGRGRLPLVEYLFGEVEVPALDDEGALVPAFDNTRSLALNPNNPRVQVLETWLGACIDEVLARLEQREQRRRKAREARLLRSVAGRIKSFLDEDFLAIQASLPWASLPSARKPEPPEPAPDAPGKKRRPPPAPRPKPGLIRRGWHWLRRLLGLEERRQPAPLRPSPGGLVAFEIRYARLGAAAARAAYDRQQGVITLNRDHPQLRTAEREAGLGSNTYRMLSFDIAFTEYALAVVDDLARQAAAFHQPLDGSALVQQILDRLGRKAAGDLEARLPAAEPGDEP